MIEEFMKKLLSIFIGLILIASGMSVATQAKELEILQIEYSFEQNGESKGWLHYSFVNSTDLLLCLPSDNFIQEEQFQVNFFVTDASGQVVEYEGAVADTDWRLTTYYIIQPGQEFSGTATIGDYHNLSEGTYTVEHLSHAVECSGLKNYVNSPLSPSVLQERKKKDNLKSTLNRAPGAFLNLDAVIEIK